jgi:RimJ/RimL family protein N-acetyltransferase
MSAERTASAWPQGALTARLEGRHVVLEPLEARHEEALFAASQDDAVWRWLTGTAPTREQFAAWFAHALQAAQAGTEGPFATLDATSGRALGSSRYLSLRPAHRGLEIGWTWLARSAWQTGANIEAKLLMLEHAFERLQCVRVEFKTDAHNERSRAALGALPAQFEGIHRHHMIQPYGMRDSAYFSVIASEWPAVRENLERRLAAKQARRSGP